MTFKVFVSYRREDVSKDAGRLASALEHKLGAGVVFQDVTGMEPGDEFPEKIRSALDGAQVVLAVIGPNWLLAADEYGRRRIDEPTDWVRQELRIALESDGVTVIPVLVDGTKMPPADALPGDISALSTRLASMSIATGSWKRDVAPLIAKVVDLCAATAPAHGISAGRKYLDWVKRKFGTVEMLGLEAQSGHAGHLRYVYVPAVTTRSVESHDTPDLRDDRDDSPQLLLDCLGEHSVYVPGAPGAGKSTFCRWLAWIIANDAVPSHAIPAPEEFAETLPPTLAGKLPVLVELRDFWPHLECGTGVGKWNAHQLETSLAAWLDGTRPGGLSGALFRDQLAAGKLVLAFDGVDEVPAAHTTDNGATHPRACLLSGLGDALSEWHDAGNRLIVTSRPYGLSESEVRMLGIPHQPLAVLPKPLQHLFIERWYAATDAGKKDENTRGLNEHLAGRQDLNELTESPLLLTALCIRFAEGQRLPDDLYDLYDGLVSSVMYGRYGRDPAKRNLAQLRLSAIAHGMCAGLPDRPRTTPAAQVSNHEADEHLREFAQTHQALENALHEPAQRRINLLARSGLLESADADHVQFNHLSFQEFLSAAHLLRTRRADEALLAAIREHGVEKGWRPTLMFLFSGLVKRDPQHALELLNELAGELARESVAENPSLAVLVVQCAELLLKKHVSLGPLAKTLTQTCLQAIEDEVELKDRHVLGLALGGLGDPRIRKVQDPAGYVEIPAGDYRDAEGKITAIREPFLLGRYPVTNSQFAEFIQAGGYENTDCWSEAGAAWLKEEGVSEPEYCRDSRYNAANQPVVGVCYWEAEAYCKWAGCRLPTSDEWGAAAGGLIGYRYPWGDGWEDGICNTWESGLRALSAVGVFPRARQADFGLDDMAGNVFNWCVNDSDSGSCALRGGSWVDHQGYARADFRYVNFHPYNRFDNIGFRVVLCSPIS